jgi:hypothetical protein
MGQYAGYVMHIVQISWFASWVFSNRCFNSNFIGAQLVKEATSASQSNFLGQQTGYQQQMHIVQTLLVILLVIANKC